MNEVAWVNVRVNCNIWRWSVQRRTSDSLWSMEVVPVTSGCLPLLRGAAGTGTCKSCPGATRYWERAIYSMSSPSTTSTDDQRCRQRTITVSSSTLPLPWKHSEVLIRYGRIARLDAWTWRSPGLGILRTFQHAFGWVSNLLPTTTMQIMCQAVGPLPGSACYGVRVLVHAGTSQAVLAVLALHPATTQSSTASEPFTWEALLVGL